MTDDNPLKTTPAPQRKSKRRALEWARMAMENGDFQKAEMWKSAHLNGWDERNYDPDGI